MSQLYPLQEDTLCRYVAHLAGEGLKHRTIKAYLSAIRYLQIQNEMGNPYICGSMPHLEYVGDQVRGGILRPPDMHKTAYYPRHTDEAAGHMASSTSPV